MSPRQAETLRWLERQTKAFCPMASKTTVSCFTAALSSSRHALRLADGSLNTGIVSGGVGGEVMNQLAFESDNTTNCTCSPSPFSSVHNDSAIPAWDRQLVQKPSTNTTTSGFPRNAWSP